MGEVMLAGIVPQLTVPSSFPPEPAFYTELLDTATEPGSIVIPEKGWYQIVLQGASGNGGTASCVNVYADGWAIAGGGGGGGAGCAISNVKMYEGDTIEIKDLDIDGTACVIINSRSETYNDMVVTSGATGGAGQSGGSSESSAWATAGTGGAGGIATGGNYANYNGANGSNGNSHSYLGGSSTRAGGAGGSAGYTGGNAGGTGATAGNRVAGTAVTTNRTLGSAGFVQIYRGDSNLV